MIEISNVKICGWEPAIRGMRNPKNSWDRSDSNYADDVVNIGENDYKLMTNLSKGGSVHAKYKRMITAYIDITAPLYWWKEFDTYKVGTVANSCSTMHKIHSKEFTKNDFSHDHLSEDNEEILSFLIYVLNKCRDQYLVSSIKEDWWQMIQLLPSSYNQKRTVMLNYEVLTNIYESRNNHKLDEWIYFCEWIKKLPYSELITNEYLVQKGE